MSDRRLQEWDQGEHSKSRERLRRKVAISKAIKSVDEFKLVYSREGSQAGSRQRRRKERRAPVSRLLQGDARVNQIVDGQLRLTQILSQGLERMHDGEKLKR